MNLSGYAALALLLLVSVYALRICMRDFRAARKSGGHRSYLYVLVAVLALAVIGFAVLILVFSMLGPFH